MRIEVLYFASLRERLGRAEETFDLALTSPVLSDLIGVLIQKYDSVRAELGSLKFAVNESFAEPSTALKPGDIVALIPPVSGG